jgi:hypothetical protein
MSGTYGSTLPFPHNNNNNNNNNKHISELSRSFSRLGFLLRNRLNIIEILYKNRQ